MSLSIEFKKVKDVQIYNITDLKGNQDPLAAPLLDPRDSNYDINGVYWNNEYYLQSKRHGFISKTDYEKKTRMRFSINAKFA